MNMNQANIVYNFIKPFIQNVMNKELPDNDKSCWIIKIKKYSTSQQCPPIPLDRGPPSPSYE